jgi:hypothetical protein
MMHETFDSVFTIESTEESSMDWINRPYICSDLRTQLAKADILLVPYEGYCEYEGPLFPVGTESIFHFIRDNIGKDLIIDICIGDPDYVELALHYDLKRLGKYVITLIAAPIIAGLIQQFVATEILPFNKDAHIEIDMVIEKTANHSSTRVYYKGPAMDYQKVVLPTIQSLTESDEDRKTSSCLECHEVRKESEQ